MKILITNHQLRNKAGSEIFTLNLAVELKRRNCRVFVFSFDMGEIAKKIQREGIPITNNLFDFKKEKFDVVHAQHNTTAIIARSIFPNVPMVFMSHGVLPELEQPPSIDLGISKFIAVSEEVADNQKKKYRIDKNKIEIVRNFIDTNKFYCRKPINKKPRKLLVLSNHYTDKVKNIIETACKELNIKVSHVGLPENSVENVEDYINSTDIVVTLGRGALEAMACERNVIVYDMHGGDGFVNENNFFEVRKNNFSGRRFKKEYSVKEFKNEILKYDPELGKKLRKIIKKENSKKGIVDKIEEIYKEVANSKNALNSQLSKGQLCNEIIFLEKFFINNEQKIQNLNNLSCVIQQKDQELDNLNQTLQQKDQQIGNLNQTLQQKDKKKDQQINNLNQIIRQKDQELDNLNQTIQQKDQELYDIRTSLRWKIPNYAYKFYKTRIKKYIPKFVFKFLRPFFSYLSKLRNRPIQERNVEINKSKTENEQCIQEVLNTQFAKTKKIKFERFDNSKVSIIIPVYNKWQFTYNCLRSIQKNTRDVEYEVIVVDNASSDNTELLFGNIKNIKYLRNNENLGFAKACNQGAKVAKAKYLLFLNNDTVAKKGWLTALVNELDNNKNASVVGSKLLFPDNTIQHAGVGFAKDKIPFHLFYKSSSNDSRTNKRKLFDAVTAACFLIRRKNFFEVGGFNENYVNGLEDIDLCLKIRDIGKKIVYRPDSVLYHYESMTDGRFSHAEKNVELFMRRWDNRITPGERGFIERK